MKNLLGGKGANLAEMCLLGLPVPAGLTITTECCTAYYANQCQLPSNLMDEVWKGMENMEKLMGLKYDDADNPLFPNARAFLPRAFTMPEKAGRESGETNRLDAFGMPGKAVRPRKNFSK